MTEREMLQVILDKVSGLDNKVSGLDSKVSDLDNKVSGLDSKVSKLETRMSGLDNRVADLDVKVSGLETRMSGLESQMSAVNERLQKVEDNVVKTNMTLENEIRVNIRRVAEGHFDLSRNLHEAIKPSNELEILAIKVSMLETDMREVKRKLA